MIDAEIEYVSLVLLIAVNDAFVLSNPTPRRFAGQKSKTIQVQCHCLFIDGVSFECLKFEFRNRRALRKRINVYFLFTKTK